MNTSLVVAQLVHSHVQERLSFLSKEINIPLGVLKRCWENITNSKEEIPQEVKLPYSIEGPKGLKFRTETEVRWARVFDQLEWSWEYEPKITEDYTPTFSVKIQDCYPVLVEVKESDNVWAEYANYRPEQIKGYNKRIVIGSEIKYQRVNTDINTWDYDHVNIGLMYKVKEDRNFEESEEQEDSEEEKSKISEVYIKKLRWGWGWKFGTIDNMGYYDTVNQLPVEDGVWKCMECFEDFREVWLRSSNVTSEMPTQSDIGIPTLGPRGITFRTRLEAKWAWMFEWLKWEWKYVPEEDYVFTLTYGRKIFVRVTDRIIRYDNLSKNKESRYRTYLDVGPFVTQETGEKSDLVGIGLLSCMHEKTVETRRSKTFTTYAYKTFVACVSLKSGQLCYVDPNERYWTRECFSVNGWKVRVSGTTPDSLTWFYLLWADATNKVKWIPTATKDVGSIPSLGPYKIEMRSRIESRWAWVFLGFDWFPNYEAIDLHGYIPDFILTRHSQSNLTWPKKRIESRLPGFLFSAYGDVQEVLVEVKGDTNIWTPSVYIPHVEKIHASGWKGSYLVVGSEVVYEKCNLIKIGVGGIVGENVENIYVAHYKYGWVIGTRNRIENEEGVSIGDKRKEFGNVWTRALWIAQNGLKRHSWYSYFVEMLQ